MDEQVQAALDGLRDSMTQVLDTIDRMCDSIDAHSGAPGGVGGGAPRRHTLHAPGTYAEWVEDRR